MTEKIGNVVLDMTYYPGEDHYSDGDIEDELLQVAMEHEEEEFPKIIEERKSWPFFYHLSPFRTNIIDWLPFKKTDRVLEIGSHSRRRGWHPQRPQLQQRSISGKSGEKMLTT